jgi:outer membrane protein OmpA-like peptidoglycan-associated protein
MGIYSAKKWLLAFSLFGVAFSSQAQKEASKWYFGEYAGVDFSANPPVALTDGELTTEEGCVTICDADGKLLFYTDGISVWNREHQKMPNGTGLHGDPSSTQSGVVIAKPNTKDKFYLFTVDKEAQAKGLSYSMVDMSLEGGMGDVVATEKNVLLRTPVTEKLTAVKHNNGKDIWVISHGWQNNEFASYLVTEKGLQMQPVLCNVGSTHQGSTLNTQGYMKSNPDGTNIALALEADHSLELFDFDNKTGMMSNPLLIQLPQSSYTYGIEFSPNGSVLYVTAAGTGKIYQYNLQAGTNEAIIASQTIVGSSIGGVWLGALQLAPDGKIYFPIYRSSYLGVIGNPNGLGNDCQFQLNALFLGNGNGARKPLARLGLPTFAQSFFVEEIKPNKAPVSFDPKKNKKIEKGDVLILKNVHFDIARHSIKPSSHLELDKLVALLKANPQYDIAIHGHTDNSGGKGANIELSRNRAKSVKEYLVAKGIAETRLTTDGFGSSQPISDNNQDAGRALNRRVEFVVK